MVAHRDETALGGEQKHFQPTLWTQVLRAKDRGSPDRREALEALISTYWKPLYFFVRRRGNDVETAKDITQGFFTAFLDRDFLKYVEQGRGKFRTFLLTALEHFMADEYDRQTAQKRGGGRRVLSFDFTKAETELSRDPVSTDTPEKLFRRQWALKVMSRALQELRDKFDTAARKEEFDSLRPLMTYGASKEIPYVEVAGKLGISEADVRNRVSSLRGRYREAILQEIRAYTDTDDQANEELQELFSALS